jgi:hypothetical protein
VTPLLDLGHGRSRYQDRPNTIACVTLDERLLEILGLLPASWSEVRLVLTVEDEAQVDRAALILASLTPGRSGRTFRLTVSATGTGAPSAEATKRVLARLEADGIDARLTLPGTAAFQVAAIRAEPPRPGLAESWDELAAKLPEDWSDLYAELELASSADVDRAALLLGPLNPFLHEGPRPSFRFRAAHRFGYGAAPQMVRRCCARLDEAGIGGRLRFLRVMSDTSPVLTQGPVWREDGRAV